MGEGDLVPHKSQSYAWKDKNGLWIKNRLQKEIWMIEDSTENLFEKLKPHDGFIF